MSYLFSWLALTNDFNREGMPSAEGPNYAIHRYHFRHRQHILLATSDTSHAAEKFAALIQNDFPGHNLQLRYLDIDISRLPEVKSAVEGVLMDYADAQMDIFFSPGSSLMQVSWYLCHTTLNLRTRLLQLMRPEHSRNPEFPDLEEIETLDAPHKSGLMLQQHKMETAKPPNAPFIASVQEEAYRKAQLVAATDRITTVIYGDSGTGKELIARQIYTHSVRKHKPFRTVNCSALSDQLLESRLFGYKKGTFTGAYKDTKGMFEEADGGTLFLDEIGDISWYMQQVLLRVLQEHEIEPLGGHPKKVNVRVIAATNNDLYDLCRQGRFRWDLFYRLTVAEIHLPPVAQFSRKDKQGLINHFIGQKQKALHKDFQLQPDKQVWEQLLNYAFPGNIREVENLIAGLYVLNKPGIQLTDLPHRMLQHRLEPHQRSLQAAQQAHIRKILAETGGNKSQAARILGISLNTLKKKI